MIPQRHILTAWMIFAVTLGGYLLFAIQYPIAYIWATYENLYGEWGQVFFLVAAFVFSLRLVFRKGDSSRWFFALLALACFYVIGEEISWGQQVFNWESPAFFKEKNLQGETNLHNIFAGPYSTMLKDSLRYGLTAGMIGYGFIYPLLIKIGFKPAVWFEKIGLAAPPLYLAPFFVSAAVLELELISFNEAEVAEILINQGIALTTIHHFYFGRPDLETHSTTIQPSKALALTMLVTFVLVAGLSVGATQAMYADPVTRARMDNRIKSGMEKFAQRYARKEMWGVTADLYRRLHDIRPDSTTYLRKWAEAERKLGDEAGAREKLLRALEIALARHTQDPKSASKNRNLTRIYRALGESAKGEEYLQRALQLGLERVRRNPDSASAAFSLGKTYELLGNISHAREQFQRAYQLRPGSKDYRKAYYRTRRSS